MDLLDIINEGPRQQREAGDLKLEQMRTANQEADITLAHHRLEDAARLTEKDIVRKGLELDIAGTDAAFKRDVQSEEQGIMTADLHTRILDASLRQTANIWRAFKNGHKALALESLNDTHLVKPGEEYKDITLDDSDQKGPDGKPIKVLTLTPKGEGNPVTVPVPMLDQLEQQYGATYHKIGNNLVRVDRNGKATPLYEPEQFVPNQDSPTGTSSKRTGAPGPGIVAPRVSPIPPAAYGVQPEAQPAPAPRAPAAGLGTGLPPAGTIQLQPGAQPPAAAGTQPVEAQEQPQIPLTRRQETHQDTRVTQATTVINKYFGISEFTGLDPKNQPKYIKIAARAEQLVRAGANPVQAANAAISEVERAEKLQAGKPPGTYSGPAPWRQ